MDPTVPDFDVEGNFPRKCWRHTPVVDAKEELPDSMPSPKVLGFAMIANVDSDHAGDKIIHRSRTVFIVFLNNSPIYWSSKKQGGIETSTFGAEFTTLK